MKEYTSKPLEEAWVESSYAVHPDIKSHTGVLMSIGKGCTYTASSKQKLNSRNTTEAKLP